MVSFIDDTLWFPDPQYGDETGLLAIGGDLSPQRLILAYSNGIFPWYSFSDFDVPLWYCPLDRFVIFPDEIHISHSMKSLINRNRYKITINQVFDRVIEECGIVDGRNLMDGAWIGPDIIEAYNEMHRLGLAMSVEVWDPDSKETEGKDRLVGGLYGICLKNAFFGESMFSRVPNASKLALIMLGRLGVEKKWHFIDCQFETSHLKSMGGRHISYEEYMRLLGS